MGRTYQVTERPEGGAFVKFFGDRFAWGSEDFKDIDEAKAAVQAKLDREARSHAKR